MKRQIGSVLLQLVVCRPPGGAITVEFVRRGHNDHNATKSMVMLNNYKCISRVAPMLKMCLFGANLLPSTVCFDNYDLC